MKQEFAWLFIAILAMETGYKLSPKTKWMKLGWVGLFLIQAAIVYWYFAFAHGTVFG